MPIREKVHPRPRARSRGGGCRQRADVSCAGHRGIGGFLAQSGLGPGDLRSRPRAGLWRRSSALSALGRCPHYGLRGRREAAPAGCPPRLGRTGAPVRPRTPRQSARTEMTRARQAHGFCRVASRMPARERAARPAAARAGATPVADALTIAHVDCDAFYATIEKRDDPSLRDRRSSLGWRPWRGVDRLLHRAHQGRALRHAHVQGARALPGSCRDQAPTCANMPRWAGRFAQRCRT